MTTPGPAPAPVTFIQTYSGVKFFPLDPRPEDVRFMDIAHALSNACRYTGHCRHFYSVAEHSVRVSWHVPPEDGLRGLLHDASEAYLHDLARPIKASPGLAFYRQQERRVEDVIMAVFGLQAEQPLAVTIADDRMAATEQRDLMLEVMAREEPYPERIVRTWSPSMARQEFITRFAQLVRGLPMQQLRALHDFREAVPGWILEDRDRGPRGGGRR